MIKDLKNIIYLFNTFTVICGLLSVYAISLLLDSENLHDNNLEEFAKIFTLAGIMLTGILGFIGKLVKDKDEAGKLTAWGKSVLLATIVSLTISVCSFVVTIFQDREKNQKTALENQKIMKEIRRTTSRISGISVFLPLQFSNLFSQNFYEEIHKRENMTGIRSNYGYTSYVTSCAKDFPDLGIPDLANKLKTFKDVKILLVISEKSTIDTLKEKLINISKNKLITTDYLNDFVDYYLNYKGLRGSLDLTEASIQQGCASSNKGASIEFSVGNDEFVLIRSPTIDIDQLRSDGSISSAEDLNGKAVLLWSNLFSSSAIADTGQPTLDYASVTYSPSGISCFKNLPSERSEMEMVPVGKDYFMLYLDFNHSNKRLSYFC